MCHSWVSAFSATLFPYLGFLKKLKVLPGVWQCYGSTFLAIFLSLFRFSEEAYCPECGKKTRLPSLLFLSLFRFSEEAYCPECGVAGCLPPWLLRLLCLLDAHSSHTLCPQVNVLTNRCRTTFVIHWFWRSHFGQFHKTNSVNGSTDCNMIAFIKP